jgi:hypothetical protein
MRSKCNTYNLYRIIYASTIHRIRPEPNSLAFTTSVILTLPAVLSLLGTCRLTGHGIC